MYWLKKEKQKEHRCRKKNKGWSSSQILEVGILRYKNHNTSTK
jgi:hypothetical protein